MTSVNLEKPFEYLKIQEYFYMFFSTQKYIIQVQSKTNHWISKNFMIICLQGILEKCFSFNVNANASQKSLWAFGGLS